MKKVGFLGVRLISYYNFMLSITFVFGSIVLIVFSRAREADDIFLLPLFFLIIFGLFCFFSALKYLRHNNIGRVCLLCCCIIQAAYSIRGLILTSKITSSFSMLDAIMLFFGLCGIWYLNTSEGKEWVKPKGD